MAAFPAIGLATPRLKRAFAPVKLCNMEEYVELGCGSRSSLDAGTATSGECQLRGILPVPRSVQAEIARQEAQRPISSAYRQTLLDRLTLEFYFRDVEVAFRRTDSGIEVLAAGLQEIAAFRQNTSPEQRQGVVYGVG